MLLESREPAGTLFWGSDGGVDGSNLQAVSGHKSCLCLISDK